MSEVHLTRRAFVSSCICTACIGAVRPALGAISPKSIGDLGQAGLPTLLELGTDPMTRIGETVWVAPIAPNVWLHTTTRSFPGGDFFPANGLVLEQREGSLLIDTTYLPEQADLLLRWSKERLSSPIKMALATHFHSDRTGGIEALKEKGIRTLAHPLTCKLASEHQMPVPEPISQFGRTEYRLNAGCELFFPGAGHTRDNIVAWLPQQRVLFGGCFLKSITSKDLGNLSDSVVADWAGSVERVHARYPTPKATIPGHGTIAGDPIAQTLALLRNQNAKS